MTESIIWIARGCRGQLCWVSSPGILGGCIGQPFPPSAREDTRSLLIMEADQTIVEREGLLLFYCSQVWGSLTWTLNIPDPGNYLLFRSPFFPLFPSPFSLPLPVSFPLKQTNHLSWLLFFIIPVLLHPYPNFLLLIPFHR